jgi:hypothetical protein
MQDGEQRCLFFFEPYRFVYAAEIKAQKAFCCFVRAITLAQFLGQK